MDKAAEWVITKSYRHSARRGWTTHWEARDANHPRGPYFKMDISGKHRTTPPQVVDSLLLFTAERVDSEAA